GGIVTADDQVAFLEEEDLAAFGGLNAGVHAAAGTIERQREDDSAGIRNEIVVEIERAVGAEAAERADQRTVALRKADRAVDLLAIRDVGVVALVGNAGKQRHHGRIRG